jgi:hypothetical protein
MQTSALFIRLISHQPAVLFSKNKSATSNLSVVFFSQNKPAPAISHQPNEHTEGVSQSVIEEYQNCLLYCMNYCGLPCFIQTRRQEEGRKLMNCLYLLLERKKEKKNYAQARTEKG